MMLVLLMFCYSTHRKYSIAEIIFCFVASLRNLLYLFLINLVPFRFLFVIIVLIHCLMHFCQQKIAYGLFVFGVDLVNC